LGQLTRASLAAVSQESPGPHPASRAALQRARWAHLPARPPAPDQAARPPDPPTGQKVPRRTERLGRFFAHSLERTGRANRRARKRASRGATLHRRRRRRPQLLGRQRAGRPTQPMIAGCPHRRLIHRCWFAQAS
jgi:hypothetical protein